MKLGSSRAMDTKRPRGSERSKPCHELQLTRRSQPPYPWPPEQAQPGVSKPCRTTLLGDPGLAHAFENGLELGQIRRVVARSGPEGTDAGDSEGPGLSARPALTAECAA